MVADFEVEEPAAVDLVAAFEVEDFVVLLELLEEDIVVAAAEDLLVELVLQELLQDLLEVLIHTRIIIHIVDIIDLIGGITDLGIGDGGIHPGGQDIGIDLGIIVQYILVEE